MGQTESQIINQVAQKTQSELILFFVIMLVFMAVVMLPSYIMTVKDRNERRKSEQIRKESEEKAESSRLDRYIQREGQIIQVVTANTEVMAGLKATLDANGIASSASFARVHERLDAHSAKLGELSSDMARVKTTQEHALVKQTETHKDVQSVLMIVDNLPHTSSFHADNRKE